MDMVRSFFGIEGVSVIEVQVKDVFAAEKIAREYGRQYERVKVESWQERNRELLIGLSSQSSSSVTIQFFVIESASPWELPASSLLPRCKSKGSWEY